MKIEELSLAEKAEWFINRVFGGRHRCRKVEDKGNHFLVVPSGCHSMATYDGGKLTAVVVMAHRLCLRAEIECNGMHGLRLMLHNRRMREGGRMWDRHPDIESVLESFPPLELSEAEVGQ